MIIWLLLSAHGILFVSHDLRVESLALEALRWAPAIVHFRPVYHPCLAGNLRIVETC